MLREHIRTLLDAYDFAKHFQLRQSSFGNWLARMSNLCQSVSGLKSMNRRGVQISSQPAAIYSMVLRDNCFDRGDVATRVLSINGVADIQRSDLPVRAVAQGKTRNVNQPVQPEG